MAKEQKVQNLSGSVNQRVGGQLLSKRGEEEIEKQLVPGLPGERLKNIRQELFCQLYSLNIDYLGNGTHAYSDAYNIDLQKPGGYQTCMVNASKLLSTTKILRRIDQLMGELILNHTSVDKELAFTINQRADLNSKVKAIAEYNKLKQRITEKSEINIRVGIVQLAKRLEQTNKTIIANS